MSDSAEKKSENTQEIRSPERRRLLKLLAAGGAVTAASMLPGKWSSPVIKTGVLPAHAQVTPGRFEVRCNTGFEFEDDEVNVTFFLSATARDTINIVPVVNVELTASIALNQGTATDTAITDGNGIANFAVDTTWADLPPNPVATVTFSDQGTYGTDSCSIPLTLPQ